MFLPATGQSKDLWGVFKNPAVNPEPFRVRAEQNGNRKNPTGCTDAGLI